MNTPLVPALRDIEILFRPFLHRKLPLRGRIVMSSPPDTTPNTPEQTISYYQQRALHNIALIITKPLAITSPAAGLSEQELGFGNGHFLRFQKQLCRATHAMDCKIAAQLYHAGMARNPQNTAFSPSGINPVTGKKEGAALSKQDIAEIAAAFGQAAAQAKVLGFDAIEIQGSGGFLIEQFLWPDTNHRHDEYGGSLLARARFAAQIIQRVRKAVGRNYPIIFKFSQWKTGADTPALTQNAHELAELLHMFCDAGVDIFHCAATHFARPALPGSALTLAAWVRLLTGKPTICTGSIGSLAPQSHLFNGLILMLHTHAVDLIALNHTLHHSPNWATALRSGQ